MIFLWCIPCKCWVTHGQKTGNSPCQHCWAGLQWLLFLHHSKCCHTTLRNEFYLCTQSKSAWNSLSQHVMELCKTIQQHTLPSIQCRHSWCKMTETVDADGDGDDDKDGGCWCQRWWRRPQGWWLLMPTMMANGNNENDDNKVGCWWQRQRWQ